MADETGDHTGPAAAAGRALRYLAGAVAAAGLLAAAVGALRIGALIFCAAVALFGAGEILLKREDRAVGIVLFLVGVLSALGVAGHLLTGL